MQSFDEIDQRRRMAGLTRKALYEAANVHKETWRRLARGRNAPNTQTLNRLRAALARLTEGRVPHGQ